MADCIFCKIIRGEIPCTKVYEDDLVFCFLDISPFNPGHTLVLPKKHHHTLFDIPGEELSACIAAASKVGKAVYKGMAAEGLNLLQNNFRAGGQLVDHAHFHLIPRYEGDGFLSRWPSKPQTPEQLKEALEKIASEL